MAVGAQRSDVVLTAKDGPKGGPVGQEAAWSESPGNLKDVCRTKRRGDPKEKKKYALKSLDKE